MTNKALIKPIKLRIIFILNAIMMILPYVFYYLLTSGKLDVNLPPEYMLYTAAAYAVTFAALVTSILKKNMILLRLIIVLNIMIALPTKAFIGIGVAIVSMILSLTKEVKVYFGND